MTPPKMTQASPVTKVTQVMQASPVTPVTMPVRTRMATRQQTGTCYQEEDEDMTDLQPTFSGPIVKWVTVVDLSSCTVETVSIFTLGVTAALHLPPPQQQLKTQSHQVEMLLTSQCPMCFCLSFRLMVYPPPPAKGGISVTNEDLHCLNDGEFLNDVIIDFYLKYVPHTSRPTFHTINKKSVFNETENEAFCFHDRYLVLEKLRKDDAQRIHVFSSFFYKRLNQRERRNVPDATNLPWVTNRTNRISVDFFLSNCVQRFSLCGFSRIQKRKHNRVKTWTRHVDLFQKDFIFVPINESWVFSLTNRTTFGF